VSSNIDEIRQLARQLNGPQGTEPVGNALLRPFLAEAACSWWVELLLGLLWIVIAVVVLKVILAFWVSGQFFLTRAATRLVFAGVWAMLKGITDIIRAFQIQRLASSQATPRSLVR
jgi:hypothetical protein